MLMGKKITVRRCDEAEPAPSADLCFHTEIFSQVLHMFR